MDIFHGTLAGMIGTGGRYGQPCPLYSQWMEKEKYNCICKIMHRLDSFLLALHSPRPARRNRIRKSSTCGLPGIPLCRARTKKRSPIRPIPSRERSSASSKTSTTLRIEVLPAPANKKQRRGVDYCGGRRSSRSEHRHRRLRFERMAARAGRHCHHLEISSGSNAELQIHRRRRSVARHATRHSHRAASCARMGHQSEPRWHCSAFLQVAH